MNEDSTVSGIVYPNLQNYEDSIVNRMNLYMSIIIEIILYCIKNPINDGGKRFIWNVIFLESTLLFVASILKNYIRFLINFPADFVLVKL